MSPPTTAEQFLDLLRKSGLLDPPRLEEYGSGQWAGEPATAAELADALVQAGLLTPFQAEQLLSGRYRNFFLSAKYKVLRPLGAGGMGQVYLCEHSVMRRRVAVKLLPPTLARDPAAVERFRREARAVALLHHPNIVTAHDADRDGDHHFLVMEYVDGPSLRQLVKERGPLPCHLAADYVRQAALGLAHAHERGLVHRDVKPSNLLVDGAGTVKILDLGLARFFLDETDDLSRRHGESPLGTTDYVAPEQVQDSHTADARADVYSLGATLYYLLAGHGPYPGGTAREKLLWHQTRQPRPIREIRPEVPEAMAALLERMMVKDPAQRCQAAEVAEALKPCHEPTPPEGHSTLQGIAITTPESSDLALSTAETVRGPAAVPPRRWPRWRSVALILAGVLAVAVAGFAVFESMNRHPSENDRPRPGPAAGPRLRLLVPAYFYPGGEGLTEWQRLLKAPSPEAIVIIVNVDSGPGQAVDPNFSRVIGQARQKGFTTIGYVSTQYAKRSTEEVKEDVDRWVRFYPGVEGIFFDEQSSGAGDVDHYAGLYEYVRKQRGLRLVVGNPGTICAKEYLERPCADVICLVESNRPLSEFRSPAWAAAHSSGRFAALMHKVEPEFLEQDFRSVAGKRIGYCYVTDREPPNPWGQLPSYWEAELEAVRRANEREEP